MRKLWCVWDGEYENRAPAAFFLLESEARAYFAATQTGWEDITEEWLAESASEQLAADEQIYLDDCAERVKDGRKPWTRQVWFGAGDPRARAAMTKEATHAD